MSDEKEKKSTGAAGLSVVDSEAEPSVDEDFDGIRRRVLALRDKAEESYWSLAVTIEEVYEKSLYRVWGFDSWREYIEIEMDWHIRKAQILVQLQKWFATMPPNIQQWVRSLGWGKAKILMRVVTVENATEWRKKIEGKSLHQIEEMLKEAKQVSTGDGASGGQDEDKPRKVSFSLFKPQFDNWEVAKEKAKDMADSDKPGHLLDLICTEFLATNAGNLTVEDYLGQIERIIGAQLIAYDEEEDALIYGADLVAKLTKEAEEVDTAEAEAKEATVQ